MIRRTVTLPEIGLIAATRAALGAGIGLLMADRLNDEQRKAVGWTLLAVGVLSTFSLFADLMLDHEAQGEPDGNGRARSPRERDVVHAER